MRRFVPEMFFLWLLLAWGAAMAGSSAERPDSPQALIKHTANEVLAKLSSQRAMLKKQPERIYGLVESTIVPHFDFERMSRWVLGRAWREATPQQRQRFVEEFRNLLIRTYASALLDYSNEQIEYLPDRGSPSSGNVTVRTRVKQPGGPSISIDYSLYKKGDEWKVFDVNIDGVSLVTNYRASFASEIRSKGIDGLIARLAKKNAERGT